MVTDQNERLSKMVKTLLDMSELQTVARDEKIEVDALVEEVLADLDPLAEEKNVILESVCDAVTMMGSDIWSIGSYITWWKMPSSITIPAVRYRLRFAVIKNRSVYRLWITEAEFLQI